MADIWLHEAVCRQTAELWAIFGSSIVTVFEVTERSVSSNLWRKVSLYCTPHYSADSTTAAFSGTIFVQLYSYSHYLCGLLPAVHCSTIYIINTTIRSC